MPTSDDFANRLEAKVSRQLGSQRVGYLLGAGSSYLDGFGYPLANSLWDRIMHGIHDIPRRDEIQAKLDGGASGLEAALDLLDSGGVDETPHRHLVVDAIATDFMARSPSLDTHVEFVKRLALRANPCVRVFSLNYDPLVERAAALSRVRLSDGFLGADMAYFEPVVFEERVGRLRGGRRGPQWEDSARPIHLIKLHGSLGWYECRAIGVRRGPFGANPPSAARRLMIPPQHRKATETMRPPYAALWSTFRECLGQSRTPLNRLACLGYGFGDEHVNAVIEAALARTDFTLLILTKSLSDYAWARWSPKPNVITVTETRCSLGGETGPGHGTLWDFKRIAKEV